MSLNIRYHGGIHEGFPEQGFCCWCGQTCWTTAETPYRPDLGQVPLHLFCGEEMRDAYRSYAAGGQLSQELAYKVSRLGSVLKAISDHRQALKEGAKDAD